ncbi:MAG: heme ABC exporter ATP-binding protein CcmA [Hyphomicrobium sp.]
MPIRRSLVVISVQLFAEQLIIKRGGRAIVDCLSFALDAGEALVLTGPNGAGKTTLLRALAGFLPLEGGDIRLKGGDSEKTLAEQSHVVGHANAVKANLTVGENVRFWAGFLGGGADPDGRASNALAHFGLAALEHFLTAELSAGQKRRLGLARLLAAERPIWLLDEPTASLDSASAALLASAVNAHTANGGLAVVATHLPLDLDRARELPLGVTERAA